MAAEQEPSVMNHTLELEHAQYLAAMSPKEAKDTMNKLLFRAAQLGMSNAKDPEEYAEWTSIYLEAVGDSDYI